VTGVRYEGADAAIPAPGVLEAIAGADVVVVCPSNPVVSIGPYPGGARCARRGRRAPGRGDGCERDRRGRAGRRDGGPADARRGDRGQRPRRGASYKDFLGAWLVDDADAAVVPEVEAMGIRCAAADTIMVDDGRAEAVARAALELVA
jgi:LPPG:FO 2-phospho-L-lactate transferase